MYVIGVLLLLLYHRPEENEDEDSIACFRHLGGGWPYTTSRRDITIGVSKTWREFYDRIISDTM